MAAVDSDLAKETRDGEGCGVDYGLETVFRSHNYSAVPIPGIGKSIVANGQVETSVILTTLGQICSGWHEDMLSDREVSCFGWHVLREMAL